MAALADRLNAAAQEGDLEALKACLAALDGQVPALPKENSPLHAAAMFGHAACVQALLAAGHDPDVAPLGVGPFPSDRGWRPLHYAAAAGHAACVGALLAGGADPRAATVSYICSTPLHCAAETGHAECAAALLAAGACPVAPGAGGQTPAHTAAVGGYAQVLRLLLAAWPDAAWQKAKNGRTPVDIALDRAHLEAAHCLLTLGAQQPASAILALLGRRTGRWRQPLYGSLAARQALTAAEWAHVPMPCAGIKAALPAVLERSEAEAGLLVCHLAPAERKRLQTAALCLARAQRVHGVRLPAPILGQLIALIAAG